MLLAIGVLAVIGFIVWAFASAPKPTEPDFTASASTPHSETGASQQTTPSLAPNDPCHRGGVTYCALNPSVTEATIRSTICLTGWTTTIRPSTSYTEALKLEQMASEGLSGGASDYEEDHRMPLELGGAPTDPTNLSPESHTTSYAKDAAENEAKREVCDGTDLRTVQAAFVAAWLGAYPTYVK